MARLDYLNPTSTQTLREGIAELQQAEGAEGDAAQNVAPDLVDTIELHDAIHVLFACSTDLKGEIAAHVWTAFGTTMTLREMHDVTEHRDHRAVLADIGHHKLLRRWIGLLPMIVSILLRCLRQKKRWPAHAFELQLDRRLVDLRQEYGIRLPEPPPSAGTSGGAALRSVRFGHS